MNWSFYVATGLENAPQAREVRDLMKAAGWHHTYDWTVHGSVAGTGVDRIREVAEAEAKGVADADLVIVLLPGGRGTHTELGMARALKKPVLIYAPPDRFEKLLGDSRDTCCFYHLQPTWTVKTVAAIPTIAARFMLEMRNPLV